MGSVYIEVPMRTLCCFVFLFLCFMNTPRTKQVSTIRIMLFFSIIWTGGDLFVRMGIYPGVNFWYSISLFALLMIPVFIYYFLFDVLDMQKQKLLNGYFVVSCLVGGLNAVSSIFVTDAKTVTDTDTAGAYTSTYGVYVLIALEVLFMIYVTVLVLKKIGTNISMRAKLAPLMLGSICILIGNLMETISKNKFPYGILGGLVLAIGLAYMMCRQNLFDISQRLLIGAIYMMAAVFIMLPIWNISRGLERISNFLSFSKEWTLLILSAGMTVWALVIIGLVITLARRLEKKQSAKRFGWLQKIQEETLSVFDVEELCQKIFDVMPELIKNVEASVVIRDESMGEFVTISGAEEEISGQKTQEEVEQEVAALSQVKNLEVVPIKDDDGLQGYLCLKSSKKLKMNYLELECIQQLAAHISVCLKNIQIYQKRYQMTVHDDLTGLYNRRYFKEYLQKRWKRGKRGSFIYLDIDDFRMFNELYGESCGDEILKWCGKIITNNVDGKDTVFRLGSNEYLVYTRVEERNKLIQVAEAIQSDLLKDSGEKPKVLQQITMSIGIALYSSRVSSFDELLKQAARASFFAKQKGKNRIEVYGESDDMRDDTVKNISAYEQISSTVYALTAAINAKDSYTYAHSMHVSQYAVMLAKELGLDSNEVRIVKEAGLLHDIGKIGIPEHILQKTTRLTDEEYKIMKSHVSKSVEMIHFLPNMNYVIPAVISHHERYDGKGYPRGLAGEQIPLLGRILAVCDCYDAMVSKRSYKEAFSKEYAIEELRKNKGTQFDPELADIFITLIPHIKDTEETDKAG